VTSIFGRPKAKRDAGLTGYLQDFGLTDLLQLIGSQQKTGVLTLREDKKEVQILFDNGMIVGTAIPSLSPEEHPLGNRLIKGGLLSPEKWKKVCLGRQEQLLTMEQALIDEGGVRAGDLKSGVRLLTFETIYGLFKWKGGTFRFEARPVSYPSELIEPLNAVYLLLDVLRQVDEWPMVAERLPDLKIVFRRYEPMATLDMLSGTPWEKERSPHLEAVYELIDGKRPAQEIIDLSFIGEFDTCKNLILLLDARMIEAVPAGTEEAPKKRFQVFHFLNRPYPALLIIGFMLLFQVVFTRWEYFPFTRLEHQGWRIIRESLSRIETVQMQSSREIFLPGADRKRSFLK
jgi:hypothetical protein